MATIVILGGGVWGRKRYTIEFVLIVIQKFSKTLGVKSQTNQLSSSAKDRLGKLDGIKFLQLD